MTVTTPHALGIVLLGDHLGLASIAKHCMPEEMGNLIPHVRKGYSKKLTKAKVTWTLAARAALICLPLKELNVRAMAPVQNIGTYCLAVSPWFPQKATDPKNSDGSRSR